LADGELTYFAIAFGTGGLAGIHRPSRVGLRLGRVQWPWLGAGCISDSGKGFNLKLPAVPAWDRLGHAGAGGFFIGRVRLLYPALLNRKSSSLRCPVIFALYRRRSLGGIKKDRTGGSCSFSASRGGAEGLVKPAFFYDRSIITFSPRAAILCAFHCALPSIAYSHFPRREMLYLAGLATGASSPPNSSTSCFWLAIVMLGRELFRRFFPGAPHGWRPL